MSRSAVDVEANDLAAVVQVHIEAPGDLARFRAWLRPEFDVEAIGLRVVVQLDGRSFRKPRSKKAL